MNRKTAQQQARRRLQIAAYVAPILRSGARRARRVHVVDAAGKVVRVVSTDEVQEALLRRAAIEIDIEHAKLRDCLRCGAPFICPRTKRGKARRRFCKRCRSHRGEPCVKCGKLLRGVPSKVQGPRKGLRRRGCMDCAAKMRAERVACAACGTMMCPWQITKKGYLAGSRGRYCSRKCSAASLYRGGEAASRKRALAQYHAAMQDEARRAALRARQRANYARMKAQNPEAYERKIRSARAAANRHHHKKKHKAKR